MGHSLCSLSYTLTPTLTHPSTHPLTYTIPTSNPPFSTNLGMRNAYRQMHGQYAELQLEMESMRTDRDSLLVELRVAKDAIDFFSRSQDSPSEVSDAHFALARVDMQQALSMGEREVNTPPFPTNTRTHTHRQTHTHYPLHHPLGSILYMICSKH